MRTSIVAAPAIITALVLGACGEEEPAGGALPPPSPAASAVSTTAPPTEPPLRSVGGPLYDAGAAAVSDLLGSDLPTFESDIEAAGMGPVRIAWRDGEYLDVTDDLVPGRVNVAIEGDDRVVIDAFVEGDPETGSVMPETTDVDPTTAPVASEATVVATFESVAYYPACGNERLTLDGTTWYIIGSAEFGVVDETFADQWGRISAVEREPSPVFGPNGFVRVIEPGPGDDVGTLVVWSDGVARWVSDSGDLDVWLVSNELEVLWDC